MIQKLKKPLLFTLALLPFAIVGGLSSIFYQLESFTPDVKAELLAQFPNPNMIYLIYTVQILLYTAVLGFFGYILSDKIGLMNPVRFEKKAIITTAVITLIAGVTLSSDQWIFGRLIPQIAESYETKPSLSNWIASLTYGGVIEEVMMRLFLMSLIAFAVWKIFFWKREEAPTGIMIFANIITAVLFAAGHFPAVISMFGAVTVPIIVRTLLLNSIGGLCFGYLYRKYGIQYAMLSHMGTHIVMKLIWCVF